MSATIRCISLWEPWASLWCAGVKIHETRHWPTRFRGRLAVHAAKKWDGELRGIVYSGDLAPAIEADPRLVERFTIDGRRSWQVRPTSLGCIVGVVDVADCRKTAGSVILSWDQSSALPVGDLDAICGDFSLGRFGWRAERPVLFGDPIPTRGRQGFWTLEDDVAEQVRSRLAA